MSEPTHFSDGTPVPMVFYWEGRPVDEMTREEAVAALKECGRQIGELHSTMADLRRGRFR